MMPLQGIVWEIEISGWTIHVSILKIDVHLMGTKKFLLIK